MFTSGDIFKAKAAELLDEIQEVKKKSMKYYFLSSMNYKTNRSDKIYLSYN